MFPACSARKKEGSRWKERVMLPGIEIWRRRVRRASSSASPARENSNLGCGHMQSSLFWYNGHKKLYQKCQVKLEESGPHRASPAGDHKGNKSRTLPLHAALAPTSFLVHSIIIHTHPISMLRSLAQCSKGRE